MCLYLGGAHQLCNYNICLQSSVARYYCNIKHTSEFTNGRTCLVPVETVATSSNEVEPILLIQMATQL